MNSQLLLANLIPRIKLLNISVWARYKQLIIMASEYGFGYGYLLPS